jgi:CIC family chloride channel protein
VAALAVIAALIGLGFGKAVYAMEDLWDAVWKGRPEWARPAVGGLALGLLLLALPQMYGVGYPVMDKATDGGSGGVFAPSLFIGATSMASVLETPPSCCAAASTSTGHLLAAGPQRPLKQRSR